MIRSLIFIVLFGLIHRNYAATDKVVCYFASWAIGRPGNGQFVPEDIDPHHCTHINYAFAGLSHDGTLQTLDEEIDVRQNGYKRVSDLKTINPALKVLISIGGATADTGAFSAVASDPAKTQTMAKSAIEFLQKHNFDGIDVDWEYPYGGDKDKFINLLTTIKQAFEPHGYLLTVAVNSIPREVGGYDLPAMSKVLDIINVMTYDFHPGWGGQALENAPLYGGDKESQWQRENRNCNASIMYWIDGGVDPQKLTIGVPFYGHTYLLGNPNYHDLGAPTAGPGPKGPYTDNVGSLGYNEICEFHRDGNVVFLEDMKVPYLYDDNLWVAFDNPKSVALKAQYAQEHNLAGVMIWSIETDDKHGFCGEPYSLLKSVNNVIKS